MSYSKFHYIEQGLKEINYDFHEKRFSSQEFALCYLVHTCKKQNINLDKEIFELIEVIEKKQSIREFLKYELHDIADIKLNSFSLFKVFLMYLYISSLSNMIIKLT